MKNLPKVPRMKPLIFGLEGIMKMQYSDKQLSPALLEYPSDYHNSPPVKLDECRDTVEILYSTEYSVCNYKCPYCLVGWAESDRKEWPQKEIFPKIINRLSHFKHKLRLNLENWGEWFISKELIDGGTFLCNRENVISLSITTNASLQKQMFDFLDNVDVSKVAFTCSYHATEVTLEKFIEQIEALQKRGVLVVIALIVLPENLEHCIELKRYAMSQDIYVRANPEPASWLKRKDEITKQQLADLYFLYEDHWKWDAHRKGGLAKVDQTHGELCTAGQNYLWLNGYGDIFICSAAMGRYLKSFLNPELCFGSIFEIEGDYLPSLTENIRCPFPNCACPKDFLRQVTLMEMFNISFLSRHEVYFKSEEERQKLLQKKPVLSL